MGIIDKIQARSKAVEDKKAKGQATIEGLQDNKVSMSRKISRAYYRLSLNEKRVMNCLISKLDSRTDTLPKLTLTAKEYGEMFNISSQHAYGTLQDAASSLMRKIITVRESDENYTEYTLLLSSGYRKGEGKIVVCVNPEVAHHLLGLKDKFISYKLLDGAAFQSSYTWRMYEILVSWAKPKEETDGAFAGWHTADVAELREQLGVPEGYRFGMFKTRVLDVVQRELFEHSDIIVKYSLEKCGRKVEKVKVIFAEDSQARLL